MRVIKIDRDRCPLLPSMPLTIADWRLPLLLSVVIADDMIEIINNDNANRASEQSVQRPRDTCTEIRRNDYDRPRNVCENHISYRFRCHYGKQEKILNAKNAHIKMNFFPSFVSWSTICFCCCCRSSSSSSLFMLGLRPRTAPYSSIHIWFSRNIHCWFCVRIHFFPNEDKL